MLNIKRRTVIIVVSTATLIGCGGLTDEAKKLGFTSVDEMKEAHAKGWHTQQQYYKDNPTIAKKAEENRVAEKNLTPTAAASDPYKGWKEHRFGGGKYVVKYPADQAGKGQSAEPNCEQNGISTMCEFATAKTLLRFQYIKESKASLTLSKHADNLINGTKGDWELKSRKDINVNGLDLIDLNFIRKGREQSALRARSYVKDEEGIALLAANIGGADIAVSKSEVDRFFDSFAVASTLPPLVAKSSPLSQSSKGGPPSGKNEALDATDENCSKVTDLADQYKREIAAKLQVSVSTIRFLSMSGCMMTVDTPVGPKRCGVGGVLWYKDGGFDAISAFVKNNEPQTGYGYMSCL